jgi:hypothetical protein
MGQIFSKLLQRQQQRQWRGCVLDAARAAAQSLAQHQD